MALSQLEEQFIPSGYEPDLYRIRHSAAHVMAQAVLRHFPDARIAIGPPIEDGFYYDFDLPRPLTPDDLAAVEAAMREIIAGAHPFLRRDVSPQEARRLFADQPYKLELIEDLVSAGSDLSLYTQDSFTDLCRGPHVAHTGEIGAFRLLSTSAAYWRGDEHQPMLQRIYGTAWRSEQELEQYLFRLEEAKKRDHRAIGRKLDLFSINDEIGPGLILWHPKGGLMRKLIEDYWGDEHEKSGYSFVYTPHIGRSKLWEKSGHLEFYADSMYAPMDIDGQQYYLKPMSCPFHAHIYSSQTRSYRDLPLRFSERGTVYRYERSGTLHGLLRVRGFTQDDAHHFCRRDQMEDEIKFALNFSLNVLRAFGFEEFTAYLSTRPEKAIGDDADWTQAEAVLVAALEAAQIPYQVDEGGGAFYGPKIDVKVKDALNREWQLSTIQFDFNLPERFDLTYVGEDGKHYRPFMVHRALLGSMERFFGAFIEYHAGQFPVWLCPVQVDVIPVSARHLDYAREVGAKLREAGLRVEVDEGSDRMQKKIRNAQEQKIPYMLVVGDKEASSGMVSVRLRTEEDCGAMPLEAFIERIQSVIAAKRGM
jgi:threonyl-tRNA synthetase